MEILLTVEDIFHFLIEVDYKAILVFLLLLAPNMKTRIVKIAKIIFQ